jgi:hypothetical protein
MLMVPDGQEIAPEEKAELAVAAPDERQTAAAAMNEPPATSAATPVEAQQAQSAASTTSPFTPPDEARTAKDSTPVPVTEQAKDESQSEDATTTMLPKTASRLSLVALAGACALAFASLLRARRSRLS